jgi:hypothetical protein
MPKDKAIETPEDLYQHFVDYKQWILENPYLIHDFVGKDAVEVHKKKTRPLTWSGFEGFLAKNGIVSHLGHYEQNDRGAYEQYLPIITRIKQECRGEVIDGALAGIYNANIAARLEGLKEGVDHTTAGKEFTTPPPINVYNSAPPLASDESQIDGKTEKPKTPES